MNFKTFISLVVALSLGLAAVWVGRQLIFGQSMAASMSQTPMSKVVVAKNDLEPGQLITAEDLTTIDLPTTSAPANAFTDAKKLEDRAVTSNVVKGQIMFEGLLAGQGIEGGLTALVPRGMRAVSVEVTESSGLAGLLGPGCRVDVIATLKQDNTQIAKTIVENAKVQAVGVKMSRDRKDKSAEPSKTVTLIVTTKDAEAIELASNSGKPRLVLRGTSDTDRSRSNGVTFAELSGQQVPAQVTERMTPGSDESTTRPTGVAVAMPPARWPLQIIRGGAESTIFYELAPKPAEQKSNTSAASK